MAQEFSLGEDMNLLLLRLKPFKNSRINKNKSLLFSSVV